MSAGQRWKSHHRVYVTFSFEHGMSAYVTRREAQRAKRHGDTVSELHVMQEMNANWQPMFEDDAS